MATRYFVEYDGHEISKKTVSFERASGAARTAVYITDADAIIYEQSGRKPPEIVAIWSRS